MAHDRRREKELKRRDKKAREHVETVARKTDHAAAESREVIQRELMDPERLLIHLRRLSELLTIVPDLRAARFPQDVLADVLALARAEVEAAPPEKRALALRAAVVPKLATEGLAKTIRAALDKTLGEARVPADRLALFAGSRLVDSWLKSRGPAEQNPVWDTVYGLSVLDMAFEGTIVARVVRDELSPDEGWAAKAFAKALAKAETGKELDRLGLDERDPAELARRYAALVRDRKRSYLLGFDALLHLVRANADFAAAHVQAVLAEGLSSAVRTTALDAFDRAYAEDITTPLVDDLASEIARRVEHIGKMLAGEVEKEKRPPGSEPLEEERRNGLLALLALRALGVERNALLRATYMGSFEVYKRSAPVDELPFVQKIWQEPGDRWALEEYERLLLARRQTHRAARVRRFLGEVRDAAKKAAAPAGEGGATPPGAPHP